MMSKILTKDGNLPLMLMCWLIQVLESGPTILTLWIQTTTKLFNRLRLFPLRRHQARQKEMHTA